MPKCVLTRRHTVGVHGVLVEVGRVEVGANLGRDGDVEVAEAEALPVEAVEPPANGVTRGSVRSKQRDNRRRKIGTQRKMVQCLSRRIVLYWMAKRSAARGVNEELAQKIGSKHPDS